MAIQKDPFVIREMRKLSDLYAERNNEYGGDYTRFGSVMEALFPFGITLNDEADFGRFGILLWMVSKMGRYVSAFEDGGHDDSLDDLAVYAMMLKELDHAFREAKRSTSESLRDAGERSGGGSSNSGSCRN